jgi:phage recombination protein Bet
MTTALAVAHDVQAWTPEQRALIKKTCAPDASDDELSMYLHVAAQSGLDPLRRQLHFMKVKGRVTFIADVNGLQERAAKEADFRGLLHAVVYEKDEFLIDQKTGEVVKHASNPFNAGKPIGAWAVVFREGMRPFVSTVRFEEYRNGNPLWNSMPSVMIDKCAKSTVLRLAYPGRFGGIYDKAEIREEKEVNPPPEKPKTEQSARAAEVKDAFKKSRMQIVDVQSGETEQQAAERTLTERNTTVSAQLERAVDATMKDAPTELERVKDAMRKGHTVATDSATWEQAQKELAQERAQKEPTITERIRIACAEVDFQDPIGPVLKNLFPDKKSSSALTSDDLPKIQEWLVNWAEGQKERARLEASLMKSVGYEPITDDAPF